MEEEQKNADNTAKKQQKKIIGKPFKPGQSGNPLGRPKGSKNFSTLFEEAAKEVAEALNLGKKPDAVLIELVKRGIREGLTGNFDFFKDLIDRLYGKPKEPISFETDIKLKLLKESTEAIQKLASKKHGKPIGESDKRRGGGSKEVSSETL